MDMGRVHGGAGMRRGPLKQSDRSMGHGHGKGAWGGGVRAGRAERAGMHRGL